MLLDNMEDFIHFNIYILIIVNIGILLAIYYEILKTKIIKYRIDKITSELEPLINSYLEGHDNLSIIKSKIHSNYKKNVAIDIINNISENKEKDISEIVMNLELDKFLIKTAKSNPNMFYLRKLAFLKSPSAYEILTKYSESTDMNIKYICYFGLTMMNVDHEKKFKIIHQLLKSDIYSDRIIEMLINVNLVIEDWMKLLEEEESEIGKVIILKILSEQEGIKNEKCSDLLLKYLDDVKEVRIAAIAAISNSRNEKYVDKLFEIYKSDSIWEIRAAITKGMINYNSAVTKDKLLVMIKDKEWWVRFNAARAISLLGEEGIYLLIDLSIDKSDEKTAALAYYFLNSNKDVYETIKNIEG